MNSAYQPTESKFGSVWLITWLAIAALLVGKSIWWTGDESQQVASAASTVDVSLNQPGLGLPQTRTVHEFKAIEDLRVGDRVVSDNPDTPSSLKLGPEQTAVDPATWRKVTLYAEETWPDGTLDTIHIETLQPPLWFELYEAKVGSQVPPPLDLLEMGLPEHLMTTVVAIESCPTLEAGSGRVVLTTVNHLNNDVWQMTAVNQFGRREELKPTGFHKFYSETRHDWVSTKDIHDREVIRGRAGPLTIVEAKKLPGTQRVYNLTVEGEHVYYVSELGLLAHNNCNEAFRSLNPDDVERLLSNQAIVARGTRRGISAQSDLIAKSATDTRFIAVTEDFDVVTRLGDPENYIKFNPQKLRAGTFLSQEQLLSSKALRRQLGKRDRYIRQQAHALVVGEIPLEAIDEIVIHGQRIK